MTRRAFRQVDTEKFQNRRREMGLTLADLAQRLKAGTSTVHAWEMGKANPHPRHLKTLMQVMGKDILCV